MFGRVIFFAVSVRGAGVAGFILSAGPAARAGACFRRSRDRCIAAEAPAPEPLERQSSGYREALLEADQRGQYAAEVLDQRGAGADACRHGRKRGLRLRFDRQRGWGSAPREGASA